MTVIRSVTEQCGVVYRVKDGCKNSITFLCVYVCILSLFIYTYAYIHMVVLKCLELKASGQLTLLLLISE